MKALLDEVNDDSENRLKLIRYAHNVKQKIIHVQQDYLEVIYELIKKKGYATQTDISESLNISLPSVSKMLQRLDESKYLKYKKYRGINLTEIEIEVAENIYEKHGLLSGVEEDIANVDAEGIEHHLHPQTLKKLREFIRNRKVYYQRLVSSGIHPHNARISKPI